MFFCFVFYCHFLQYSSCLLQFYYKAGANRVIRAAELISFLPLLYNLHKNFSSLSACPLIHVHRQKISTHFVHISRPRFFQKNRLIHQVIHIIHKKTDEFRGYLFPVKRKHAFCETLINRYFKGKIFTEPIDKWEIILFTNFI